MKKAGYDEANCLMSYHSHVQAVQWQTCHGYCFLQFCEFLDYAKNLKYEETPDYNLFKGKMMQDINAGGQKFDKIYDWTDIKKLKKDEKPKTEEKIVESRENNKLMRVCEQWWKISYYREMTAVSIIEKELFSLRL